jgi:hypothetical protein
MFLPLRYSIHGLFEIGFRFVVPAGETGSDFKYIFRQERSLKGRQRTGLAVSFTQMRLQMNRRQQEGQIFVDIAALRC